MKSVIYDFETLGVDHKKNPVVLALAMLVFDDDEFLDGDGIDYDDAVDRTHIIKFGVTEQVKKYGRIIEPDVLRFWKDLKTNAKDDREREVISSVLDPSDRDVSIEETPSWIKSVVGDPLSYKKVFTRGNTFDPLMLGTLPGGDPFPWWTIRDTRSYLDGMLLGTGMNNKFIPDEHAEKFVHHHPAHDIVMDVMRMQTCHRSLLL